MLPQEAATARIAPWSAPATVRAVKRCLQCDTAHGSDGHRCPGCGYGPSTVEGHLAHAPELAHAGGGYDVDLFANMASLEAQSFWFRSRNKLIAWAVGCHQATPHSILEIGCGTGFVLTGLGTRFPNAALHGSEIFVEGLAHARERMPAADLMQMDARAIPYRDEFDVLGAFDVLEHIEEDTDVLGQMFDALHPGGLLVVSVPQHQWMWSPADDHAHHVRRYARGGLDTKVRDAGFEVLRSTSFVSLLLPLMLVSRWFARRSDAEYDPRKEMELPRGLNMLLGGVMAFERLLIRAGLDLPVGGSRLVVARRPK